VGIIGIMGIYLHLIKARFSITPLNCVMTALHIQWQCICIGLELRVERHSSYGTLDIEMVQAIRSRRQRMVGGKGEERIVGC
jgi:hypothetical protein